MRHEKSATLIELARELANSRIGLTLDEMAQKIGVKRRTVERMRDRLLEMFDSMEEILDPPTKRWRINGRLDGFLQAPTSGELAALKSAQNYFEQTNIDAAFTLKALENKLMTAIGPKMARLAPDIEALMQAEAIAVHSGPKPNIDRNILRVLRDAILMMRRVNFNYEGGSKSKKRRDVIPYGILFGGDAYLIALDVEKTKPIRPQVWRIDKIRNIELSNQIGAAPEDFSLQDFANRSFGVFQEDNKYEVELLVLKEFTEELGRWQFHPLQEIIENPDGSMTIKMSGSGLKELAWGLMRWGGKLKIINPPELIEEVKLTLTNGQNLY